MGSESIDVAVIGLGLMGSRMAHALRAHPGFRIACAWDPDAARRDAWCAEFETEPARDWDAVLQRPEVQAVYIASPPHSHVDLALQSLAAGKAILLEKPLAADLAQAQRLRDACVPERLTAGRACMNFPLATLPGLARMRRDLAAGEFGTLHRVEIQLQFSAWPRTWHTAGPWLAGPAEGGFCREVLSHFVYLTQTLLGPMQLVASDLTRGPEGTETWVVAGYRAGGIPVSLQAGVCAGAPDHNRWTLFGEKTSVRVEDWRHVEWSHGTDWQTHVPEAGEDPGLGPILDGWKAALHGNPHPLATIEDGFHVLRSVEALL